MGFGGAGGGIFTKPDLGGREFIVKLGGILVLRTPGLLLVVFRSHAVCFQDLNASKPVRF